MTEKECAPTFSHLSGTDIAADADLLEAMLHLDRSNMAPILEASGFPDFPWEKRVRTLVRPETRVFLARLPVAVAAYLELDPIRAAPDAIYISSLQIAPAYRRTTILRPILGHAALWLRGRSFSHLVTEVQTSNVSMLTILSRLGFRLEEGKHPHTLRAVLPKDTPACRRIFSMAAGVSS